MSKYKERLIARKMRTNGYSINVISDKLKISKSTVSLWCRDIILTEDQITKLNKNKGISQTNGQRMGSVTNRNKKIKTILDSEKWAREKIQNISQRDLLFIGVSLYWSEGSKTESTSTLLFSNSDPEMIIMMKKFLIEIMGVKKEDIACRIQINITHRKRIAEVLNFWKKVLGLPSGQIRKPYFVKTKVKKVYENYDNYFGVCRLFVLRGKWSKYKILGLIKATKKGIMSA